MPDIACYKIGVFFFSLFHNNLIENFIVGVRQFNVYRVGVDVKTSLTA